MFVIKRRGVRKGNGDRTLSGAFSVMNGSMKGTGPMKYQVVILSVIFMIATRWAAGARVEVYPEPQGIEASDHYAVTVVQGGKRYPAFVYKSVSHFHLEKRGATSSYTTFSFDGPITVEVTKLDGEARSCLIRPGRHGITAELRGNTAVFTLDRPRKLSVEFNGDITHSMLLFADGLETDPPKPGDKDVIYFGPGQHTIGPEKLVPANTTVYLAGGAYVWGSLKTPGGNVVIRGRGVLSGGKWRKYNDDADPKTGMAHQFHMVDAGLQGCRVEGITIVDFPMYAVRGAADIINLKTIGWYYNCDGLDAHRNREIKDCFLKVNDDALKLYWDNARVEEVTIWQYTNGAPFQWGWHGMSSKHVVVRNCDVIHIEYLGDANNRAVFNAAAKTGGRQSDYLFENITIEEARPWRLFKFKMTGDTSVDNTTFRNLRLAGPPSHDNQMSGKIRLTFENMTIAGKPVGDARAAGFAAKDAAMAKF